MYNLNDHFWRKDKIFPITPDFVVSLKMRVKKNLKVALFLAGSTICYS